MAANTLAADLIKMGLWADIPPLSADGDLDVGEVGWGVCNASLTASAQAWNLNPPSRPGQMLLISIDTEGAADLVVTTVDVDGNDVDCAIVANAGAAQEETTFTTVGYWALYMSQLLGTAPTWRLIALGGATNA